MKTKKTIKTKKINTSWFTAMLDRQGMSERELARRMGLDPSSLFRLLRGQRRLQVDEAIQIGSALNQPVSEVLKQFGTDLSATSPGAPPSPRSLKVTGYLDGALVLRLGGQHGGLRGDKAVPCPFGDRDLHVARFQTAGTEFSGWDGALVFFRSAGSKGADPDYMGTAVMVQIAGEKELRLRVISKGFSARRYNLSAFNGRAMEDDVIVEAVHPVVWLKM